VFITYEAEVSSRVGGGVFSITVSRLLSNLPQCVSTEVQKEPGHMSCFRLALTKDSDYYWQLEI